MATEDREIFANGLKEINAKLAPSIAVADVSLILSVPLYHRAGKFISSSRSIIFIIMVIIGVIRNNQSIDKFVYPFLGLVGPGHFIFLRTLMNAPDGPASQRYL